MGESKEGIVFGGESPEKQELGDETKRKRIEISSEMSPQEIMDRHEVSRATAFRSRERGWLFQAYHQKEVITDAQWAEKMLLL